MAGSIEDLSRRFHGAWSSETASKWTAEHPALGQCSVTAIAVQRIAGGEILKTDSAGGMHFYNRIDGVRYDFTASQFDEPLHYQDLPSNAADALSDTSPAQLTALMKALGEEA